LAVVRTARALHAQGEPFWLVVNPDMVSYVKDETGQAKDWIKTDLTKAQKAKACHCEKNRLPHFHYEASYPEIHEIKWEHMILDEAHKAAVGNTKSVKSHAFAKVQSKKRMILTGTPMGGKPLKLFGLLQFLRPDVFTSKWTWAERWLKIDEGEGYGKTILNELKDGVEEQFNAHLIPFVLRRTKDEVLKWLPKKDIIDLWVEMTPAQAKQYAEFEADAYLEMEEGELYGKAVLDQYTRLRQFAVARQTIERGTTHLLPTQDSGKLEQLEELLEELGLTAEDPSDEQVVIFSQWTEVVDMVAEWLRDRGVTTNVISGKVAHRKRTQAQKDFQAGKVQAMVLNVMAGGVAINLDNANTAIFLDETWNPDDCEQAEDRIHRASRIHQVTCYYIRSKGTIEEELFDTTTGKSMTNEQVLDWRKRQASVD
jgi:SNF2 family DNA or RNA helicase